MNVPFSPLAQAIKKKYGGYAMTKSIIDDTSVNEAHDSLILEGTSPWTAEKLDPEFVKEHKRKITPIMRRRKINQLIKNKK